LKNQVFSLKTGPLRVLTGKRPLLPNVEEVGPCKEVEEDGCNKQDNGDLDLEKKSAKI
jgi:hypothetical protein